MSAKASGSRKTKRQIPSDSAVAVEVTPAPAAVATRRAKRLTAVVVVGLLIAFAALAWLAVTSKSPTYDEPLHAVSAWLQVHERDFRVDSEDPPLWKYWPGLTSRRDFMRPSLELPPGTPIPQTPPLGQSVELNSKDPSTPALRYRLVAEDAAHEWPLVVEMLYPCGRSLPAESNQCPDSDAFIQRMRAMMLVLGVALGVVVATWGWQLGGSVTAIAATLLYCFDPNFLGHAALVKNDVPLTLIGVALFWAVWRAGRRVTVGNAAAIALLCAAAVTTKYSGLLFGPTVTILLVLRALLPEPWPALRRTLETRRQKLALAGALLLLAFAVSYVGVWAAYGFRFGPATDRSIELNFERMMFYTALNELTVEHGRMPTAQQMEAWEPSGLPQALLIFEDLRVLPQAWLHGLLYTYQSALLRPSYLLGKYSNTGWWYYFPVAMLTKTPLATLAACACAIVVLLLLALRTLPLRAVAASWTAACLLIPPAIFLIFAMRSNLNLGLRHILPVYPFIYLGIALAVAEAWRRCRSATKWIAGGLAVVLAIESLVAFPDYIAFFNVAAGGKRGGFRILGDSNLDWGQDLKLLAQWQQERQRTHPNENLYLVYFGLADPWAYGIRYINFPGGYKFGHEVSWRREPGVLAISATALQGIYLSGDDAATMPQEYAQLRAVEPFEVLGGSIYLYHWPPAPGRVRAPRGAGMSSD